MSETIAAARTEIQIIYNDRDVTRPLAPLLKTFDFQNFANGEVDDLQVSFGDPDGRWLQAWHPNRGARVRAKIVSIDPSGRRILDCGEFVIDSPGYNRDGITLRGTSAAVTTELRRQTRARMWMNATLQQVVAKIATEDGVTIVFQGADSPPMSKAQQKDISDLEFLLKCCENEGFTLRVDSNRLVVQRRADFDQRPASRTIRRGEADVLDYDFCEEGLELYRACKVAYDHPDFRNLTVVYVPPGAPEDGPVLVKRAHVANEAEALRRAKAYIDAANRARVACTMTLRGDTTLVSGLTVELTNWGVYDGRYAIDQASHCVPPYTTTLALAKVG